jgi:hypothetical protein
LVDRPHGRVFGARQTTQSDGRGGTRPFCLGRYLRTVSTRTLLILAALTGLAILIAFTIQVLLVS